ncbi:ABC transporter ATP-binding protein [Occallatibacter riparius]|uniref:ABC transporter ATP-binding protein/permease n=1 Tax=Occallatibacter riparius TaxID=1002689 RepID=A0A9J7BIS1_9BACT|nr:ABC transporter ATP-binding protein [Occallatibacter riparius]UWZ82704.1 ABC transporter ATP-binding protein/permease [Occallatibacter riparius]
MKRFIGLLRFGLPYTFYWLPGVLLLAAVGFLDALRMAFFVPILGVVLKPDNPSSALPLFPFAPAKWQFDIHRFFPPALHIHNVLTVVAWALVGSTVLKGICDYVGTYLVNYAGFGLITDLRNRLYEVIMRRSASFFHRHPTASILSTLINDVDKVQTSVSTVLGDFLQQFFTFVFTVALVIMLGGRLSWVLLLFVPVVITSARRIGRSVQSRTRTGQDKLAEIQNILHETVTGHRIVKAFSNEIFEITRFKSAARRLFKANLRSVRIQSISSPLMDTIGSIAIALLLWIGRNEINHGRMDAAVFITFIIALFKLYDPVRRFASYYNSFHQALGASASIFTFLEHRDDVKEKPHPRGLPGFHKFIKFENVGFSYSSEDGEHQILHNIDLEVRAGEVLALVGPSGAGKSTLVNLIPRFFDVTSGRILIDNYDIRDLSLNSLRRQIAQVTQETILFNDTVRHNIAYGQPEMKFELVEAAARNALAHDFITRMPQGYDTVIGEKGFRLSGGERQRMAIARAILKNAPILILDEATSALDAESESLVQTALANLIQNRTVVVIAHRLSTVRRANRIAVVEEGRITAIGSHDELLITSPTYRRLYQLQFMEPAEGNGDRGPNHGLDQLEPEPTPPQLLEPALSREAEE